jgi:Protein of unknown function (DUF2716)
MQAWQPLNRTATDEIWKRIYSRLQFRTGVNPEDWPGILEPGESVTYSISRPFQGLGSRQQFVEAGMVLNLATLAAFRRCLPRSGYLHAMDWQHPCYEFHPHEKFEAADPLSWEVQPFPDGDYYFFLSPELRFGTFGHPWEQTFCVFGRELMDVFDDDTVPWLGPVVRRNGGAA